MQGSSRSLGNQQRDVDQTKEVPVMRAVPHSGGPAAQHSYDLLRILAGMPLALPFPRHLPAAFHILL